MGKKHLRKRVRSLQRRVTEHENKIAQERARGQPKEGVVRHWEKELSAFRANIERALRRFGRAR